jgi:hypothetical protein
MPDTANSVDGHMSNLENIGTGMEPTASQLISKEPNPLLRHRSAGAISSLSGQLRERAAPLDGQIEALLRLPGAIRTCADYKDWLGRLLVLYDPLECALGLYVIERATLGGRLILPDLEPRVGASIAGATRFFGGRGEAVDPMWRSFVLHWTSLEPSTSRRFALTW